MMICNDLGLIIEDHGGKNCSPYGWQERGRGRDKINSSKVYTPSDPLVPTRSYLLLIVHSAINSSIG